MLPDNIKTAYPTYSSIIGPLSSNAIMVERGFLSLSMLSRCSHLDIAKAAPPCASSSGNDWRRTRIIAMLRHFLATFVVKNHAVDTSAMFPTCSRKHRRCIFEMIVWVIYCRCSRTALRRFCLRVLCFLSTQ